MPVKWDNRLDSYLLIQILDLKNVSINANDAAQISKAWPAHLGEKPTVRAIQEHVSKLKKDAAATGGGTSSTPKRGKTASMPIRTPTTTPSKRAATNTASAGTRKRKKVEKSDSDDDDSSIPTPVPEPRASRARREASLRVKELIKKAYASDTEDEDTDNEEIEEEDVEDEDYGEDEQEQENAAANGEVEEMLEEAENRVKEDKAVKVEVNLDEELA